MNSRFLQQRPLLGRILLFGLSLAVSLGVAEILVRGLDLFAGERAALYSPEDFEPGEDQPSLLPATILHPYRGWMVRPGRKASFITKTASLVFPDGQITEWARQNENVGVFGSATGIEDYRSLAADEFRVGIFGGSVAVHLSVLAGDHLAAELAHLLDLDPSTIRVVNMGAASYKQPQQLFALSELALLGVELDLVVNIDGFNEVVFGERNARLGVHPLFPNAPKLRTILDLSSVGPTPERILASAEIIERHRSADELRRWAANAPAARSWLMRSVVGRRVLRHEDSIRQAEERLAQMESVSGGVLNMANLPADCLGSKHACWDLVADLWVSSSKLMARIADEIGARYLHVVQPNQYAEASKTLSPFERKEAYLPGSPMEDAVAAGYPALLRNAGRLEEAGIRFEDLTLLFEDHPETIYVDNCCHYNLAGNYLLAEAVADAAAELF